MAELLLLPLSAPVQSIRDQMAVERIALLCDIGTHESSSHIRYELNRT